MIRLNNKGQALVLFVVLFPIIILVLISVVDVGRALYEKQSIDNTCNMVIDYGLDNLDVIDENKLIDMVRENTKDLNKIDVLIDNEEITVKLVKKYRGIIGTTFGFDLWEMNSSYRGKNENGKKVIERIK